MFLLVIGIVLLVDLENQNDNLTGKIDSLVVELQKRPDTVFITRVVESHKQVRKKRVKPDTAEVARIERIIFYELLENEVDSSMARIIVAIAKHESRSFSSSLFRETHNLFGMTWPPKRPTLATGRKIFLDHGNVRRFCTFRSTAEATHDMVLYLKHWGYPLDIKSPEKMVRLMKSKRYFEASEKLYLRAVQTHLSKLSV